MPTLLLTRAEAQNDSLVQSLHAPGAADLRIVVSPLIQIADLNAPMPDLGGRPCRGLIFTSANSIPWAKAQSGLAGLPAFCVGDRTAAAARAAGFEARQAGKDAAELLATVQRLRPPGPLILPHGVHTRGAVAETLNSAGIETIPVTVYDQVACALTAEAVAALQGDAMVIAPVYSPRTAALLRAALAAIDRRAPLALIAISPAAAEPLGELSNAGMELAQRPDGSAMRDAVAARIAAGCLP